MVINGTRDRSVDDTWLFIQIPFSGMSTILSFFILFFRGLWLIYTLEFRNWIPLGWECSFLTMILMRCSWECNDFLDPFWIWKMTVWINRFLTFPLQLINNGMESNKLETAKYIYQSIDQTNSNNVSISIKMRIGHHPSIEQQFSCPFNSNVCLSVEQISKRFNWI